MKTTKLYIKGLLSFCLTLSLSLVIGSCTRDAVGDNDLDEVTVTFSLDLPSATRALDAAGENTVKTIDILVFKNNRLQYTAVGSNITSWNTAAQSKNFTVRLIQDASVDLIVLVNARPIVSSSLGITVDAIKSDIESALLHTSEGLYDVNASGFSHLPMWGSVSGVTIDGSTTSLPAIPVIRMHAKVDVDASIVAANFKLRSVHVYNYQTRGRLVPDVSSTNWDGVAHKALLPTVPPTSARWGNPAFAGAAGNTLIYTDITSSNTCFRDIYLHESNNLGASITSDVRTCLVIGGLYGSDTDESYYRVDFIDSNGDFLNLLRNHTYVIDITSVTNPGYTDPDDAFRSDPVNMHVTVIDWANENLSHELQ